MGRIFWTAFFALLAYSAAASVSRAARPQTSKGALELLFRTRAAWDRETTESSYDQLRYHRRSTRNFNITLATYLLRVSFTTYSENESTILSMTCPKCTDSSLRHLRINKVYDGGLDVLTVFGYDSQLNAVIVAFRGSETIVNWLNNFKIGLVSADDVFPGSSSLGVKIHQGFYESYKSARPEVLKEVKFLLSSHPGAKLIVTGHSLGAALATICAADMVNSFPRANRLIMYNFGSPRVGNPSFVDYYTARVKTSMRVVHSFDPATHVPARDWGYKHVPVRVVDPISGSSLFHPIRSHLTYLGVHHVLGSGKRRRRAARPVLRMRT